MSSLFRLLCLLIPDPFNLHAPESVSFFLVVGLLFFKSKIRVELGITRHTKLKFVHWIEETRRIRNRHVIKWIQPSKVKKKSVLLKKKVLFRTCVKITRFVLLLRPNHPTDEPKLRRWYHRRLISPGSLDTPKVLSCQTLRTLGSRDCKKDYDATRSVNETETKFS